MSNIVTTVLTYIKNLWKTEPTVVVAAIASAVVFVAANFGIVIDEQTVQNAILLVIPVLLGGVVTRSQVTPSAPTPTGGSGLP